MSIWTSSLISSWYVYKTKPFLSFFLFKKDPFGHSVCFHFLCYRGWLIVFLFGCHEIYIYIYIKDCFFGVLFGCWENKRVTTEEEKHGSLRTNCFLWLVSVLFVVLLFSIDCVCACLILGLLCNFCYCFFKKIVFFLGVLFGCWENKRVTTEEEKHGSLRKNYFLWLVCVLFVGLCIEREHFGKIKVYIMSWEEKRISLYVKVVVL